MEALLFVLGVKMLRLCVAGCFGRMGQAIIAQANNDADVSVEVGTSRDINHKKDKLPNLKVSSLHDLSSNDFDVCIDFTLPESTIAHLDRLANIRRPVVIGTTGLSDEHLSVIDSFSKQIPIVLAPNTSIGVNIMYSLVELAAKIVPGDWRISIDETHHTHKKDNPSGTAIKLKEVMQKHISSTIRCEGKREGEVIGTHNVRLLGQNEELVVTHEAKDRSLFAEGAILAAKWLSIQKPGLYSMKDVLKQQLL